MGLLDDAQDGENHVMDSEPPLETTRGTSTRQAVQSHNRRQHAGRTGRPEEEGNERTSHATTSLNLLPSVGDFRNNGVLVMPVTVRQGLHRRHTVRHIGSHLHRGAPLTHILGLLQADRTLWTWHQEHSRRAVLKSHKGQSTADVRHQHCRVQQHTKCKPSHGAEDHRVVCDPSAAGAGAALVVTSGTPSRCRSHLIDTGHHTDRRACRRKGQSGSHSHSIQKSVAGEADSPTAASQTAERTSKTGRQFRSHNRTQRAERPRRVDTSRATTKDNV